MRAITHNNALPGSGFTSGPFGTGTIVSQNGTSPANFIPVGGDRTISNPVALGTISTSGGFSASNISGSSYNLTMAGPITLYNGRAGGVGL